MSDRGAASDGVLGGFMGTLSYLLTWVLIFSAAIIAMVALYKYLPLRKRESYGYYATELSCMTGLALFLLLQFVLVRNLQPLPTLAFLLLLIPIGVKTLMSAVKEALTSGADRDSESGRNFTIVSSSSSQGNENGATQDVLLTPLGKDRVRGFSAIRVNQTLLGATFGEAESCVAVLTALSKSESACAGVEWVFKIDVDPASGALDYHFIAAASGKARRSKGASAEHNDTVNLVRKSTLYLRSALLSAGFTTDNGAPVPGVELFKSLSIGEENHGGGVAVAIRGLPEKAITIEDLETSSSQKQRTVSRSTSTSPSSVSLFHPVGRLVRFMVAENIAGSYVVRFKRTKPPEGVAILDNGMIEATGNGGAYSARGSVSSSLQRLRNSVAGRLRLADGEELAEEVMAGVRRGYWSVESYVALPKNDGDGVVKVSSTIVSCFSGGVRSVETATMPIDSSSCDSKLVGRCHPFTSDARFRYFTGEMSSDSLASFITLSPPYPASSCEARSSAEFEVPPSNGDTSNGLLHLGRAYFRGTPVGYVKIPVEDLAMHIVPLGETGFGKTTFVASLLMQLWDLDPTINWIIMDLKGEYHRLLQGNIDERIEVLEAEGAANDTHHGSGSAGIPLRINLLNTDQQSGEHEESVEGDRIARLFSALKESLAGLFKENSELSPMMERILFESLKIVMTTPVSHGDTSEEENTCNGFFDALFREVGKCVTAHKRRDIVMSGEALKNRLERFRRGTIGNILNNDCYGQGKVNSFNPDFREMLRTKKMIIDLSGCIRKGCSKEDIRLLLNVITSIIFEEALKRESIGMPKLCHLTVIEEANILVPDVLHRKTMGDLTSTEDMILTARGFGEGLILVAQRPTISSFILANAGTKVVFRSPYDAARVGRFMGLNEAQENVVKSLKKFEAVITTVQGGPYEVSTARPQQPLTPVTIPSQQPRRRDTQHLTPTPISPPSATVETTQSAIKATEAAGTIVEEGRRHCLRRSADEGSSHVGGVDCTAVNDDNAGKGGVAVDREDVERLLKRRGTSSSIFELLKSIASSSFSCVKVDDIVLGLFGGKLWKYLDTIGDLEDARVWRKPLVTADNSIVTLTEYGIRVWRAIQQRRKEADHSHKKNGRRR